MREAKEGSSLEELESAINAIVALQHEIAQELYANAEDATPEEAPESVPEDVPEDDIIDADSTPVE